VKVSDITVIDLVNYTRADDSEESKKFLEAAFAAAKGIIKSRTGNSDEELDEHEEFSIAVFAMVADMYDNRSMSAESTAKNLTVEAILNLHDKNFL